MRKITAAVAVLMLLCAALCACGDTRFNEALLLYEESSYEAANELLEAIPKPGREENSLLADNSYMLALAYFEEEDYIKADEIFSALGDYADSRYYSSECKYLRAVKLKDAGSWALACDVFSQVKNYRDASGLFDECAKKSLENLLNGNGDVAKISVNNGVYIFTLSEELPSYYTMIAAVSARSNGMIKSWWYNISTNIINTVTGEFRDWKRIEINDSDKHRLGAYYASGDTVGVEFDIYSGR